MSAAIEHTFFLPAPPELSGQPDAPPQHLKLLAGRGHRAAQLLLRAAQEVLSSSPQWIEGGGKRYLASRPGSPPALQTGAFRASWRAMPPQVSLRGGGYWVKVAIWSPSALAMRLERGSSRMAPRPYRARVLEKALPGMRALVCAPLPPIPQPDGKEVMTDD